MSIVNLLDYPKVNISNVTCASIATSVDLKMVAYVDINFKDSRSIINANEIGLNTAL